MNTSDTNKTKSFLLEDDSETESARWYVVQIRSRYEDIAVANIRARLETFGIQDKVEEILVPTRTRKRVLHGKTKDVEEKVYPGYILIKALLNNELKNTLRSTEYVNGFVGGAYPTPLTEKEVTALLESIAAKDDSLHATDFEIGDVVKIVDGPFSNLQGKISEVSAMRGRVRVLVSMFGRETPVELEFFQVERIL